ncbi:hypothetical protein EDD36DRAFT_55125 [Exophiala viscosa]|uniref:Uncharacterized protein n=1 Tax=Exophiala viscosa TaxID=2486360 RepID=A0AAN6DPN1_9EURO|nr:hypothetical protein EDD36DRAFT_55125 [Exophiala viscosa]
MSGIGEALAIVSCVAGLIQAYDAGCRIFKQIKARRQNHDALPPSDLLEESFEKGKRQVEEVVADGNKRFGPSFEEGDTTAQLAIMRITIATQNALLAGLTQARDDDGVIDFETCIDISDKGRSEALIALHALFQRKLEEEMDKKKNVQVAQSVASPQSPPVTPPAAVHSRPMPAQPMLTASREQSIASPSSSDKIKKPRFSRPVFRPKDSNKTIQMADTPPVGRRDTASQPLEEDVLSRPPRRDTNASTDSSATWSSAGSRGSNGAYDHGTMQSVDASRRSYTDSASFAVPPRQGTSFSTASTLAPISNYGGCCKNAHELRGNPKKGLSRAFSEGARGRDVVYKCASTKCHFKDNAIWKNKGWEMDDRIRMHTAGLRYRWLFLAKSHMQQQNPSERHPSYRCLICTMLGDEPATFQGSEALLDHVAGHQGAVLGETQLDGALVFSNDGAKAASDNSFDIELSKVEQQAPTPISPVPDHGAAVVVAANVTGVSHVAGSEMLIRESSATTYQDAHDYNPWAA